MRAVVYHGPNDIRLETVPEPVLQGPRRRHRAGDHRQHLRQRPARAPRSDAPDERGRHHRPRVRRGGGVGRERGRGLRSPATGWWGPRPSGAAAAAPAAQGLLSACENGAIFGNGPLFGDLDGAQADYVRVPFADVTLHHIPAGLSDERVIFAGDILPTAYSAVAGLAPGSRGAAAGRHRGHLRRRPGGAVRRRLGPGVRPGAHHRGGHGGVPPGDGRAGWAPTWSSTPPCEDVRQTRQGSHRRLGRRLRGRGRRQAGDSEQRRRRVARRAGSSPWWACSSSRCPSTRPGCSPRTSPSPSAWATWAASRNSSTSSRRAGST